MSKKIFFLSRDANWQHYRNEIFTYLGHRYNANVEILTTGPLKPYLQENSNLTYVRFANWLPSSRKANFFPGALWYILRNRPSCVIAQNNITNFTEYVAVILCRIMGIRFLWWTHAYEHKPISNFTKRILKDLFVRFFLQLAHGIITYSQAGSDYIISRGIKQGSDVFLAPNTLDTKKLAEARRVISANFDPSTLARKMFPTAGSDAKFLLFSGRINKYKKVDNLIKALPKILEALPNVFLIVIGDGYKKQECVDLSKSLGLSNHIYFKDSTFDPIEVGKYFELADLFVMPGLVGLAIVHAFSFGLPLITEDINYHSPEIQYLKAGENGYLVKENDVLGLASKIVEILSQPELLSTLSRNALDTVHNEANIDTMVDSMYEAIQLN